MNILTWEQSCAMRFEQIIRLLKHSSFRYLLSFLGMKRKLFRSTGKQHPRTLRKVLVFERVRVNRQVPPFNLSHATNWRQLGFFIPAANIERKWRLHLLIIGPNSRNFIIHLPQILEQLKTNGGILLIGRWSQEVLCALERILWVDLWLSFRDITCCTCMGGGIV